MIKSDIGYIICESFTEPSEVKIQPKMVNGKVVGEGILQTADQKNRNGRYYAEEELFPQLTAPRTMELLNAGYLRAELGHPLSKDLQRQSTIDDTKTCAKFLKLWTNGKDVWAWFTGTNNEYGKTFDMDLKEGCLPAWSLRALGSIEQTRRGAEVKNLRLITWDQVIYPSHPTAYTKGIVSESTNIAQNNKIIVPKNISLEEASKDMVVAMTDEKVINFIQAQSSNLKFVRECFDFRYSGIHVNEAGTKVLLTTTDGETLCINMESYVHNELMNYAAETQVFRKN